MHSLIAHGWGSQMSEPPPPSPRIVRARLSEPVLERSEGRRFRRAVKTLPLCRRPSWSPKDETT